MFDNIDTTTPAVAPAPPPRPAPQRSRWWIGVAMWLLRCVAWYRDNITPIYGIRRTLILIPEHHHWLTLDIGPTPLWKTDTTRAIRTWKWNAKRIANAYRKKQGEIYEFGIQRL